MANEGARGTNDQQMAESQFLELQNMRVLLEEARSCLETSPIIGGRA